MYLLTRPKVEEKEPEPEPAASWWSSSKPAKKPGTLEDALGALLTTVVFFSGVYWSYGLCKLALRTYVVEIVKAHVRGRAAAGAAAGHAAARSAAAAGEKHRSSLRKYWGSCLLGCSQQYSYTIER